ncbi:unnamed protein product [Chrysoparadoxa australica]
MVKRVLVTGGAGQISYALLPLLCSGRVFGPEEIELVLLDIMPASQALAGVVMEIEDCAYPLVKKVSATTDAATAFKGVQVAILLGGFPRKAGMERQDLIKKNVQIMRTHGEALNHYADPDVKVLVVANPANTNCLTVMKYAAQVPPQNFSALTRLDHDRLRGMLVTKVNETLLSQGCEPVNTNQIRNVCIWGNHSSTQVPDVTYAEVQVNGAWQSAAQLCNDPVWQEETLVQAVQGRGAEVIRLRKLSSAMSAANAISTHLRLWITGTFKGDVTEFTSMAVLSDNNPYGIPDGLVCSFPVVCGGGKWAFKEGLTTSDADTQARISVTTKELQTESDMAKAIIAGSNL